MVCATKVRALAYSLFSRVDVMWVTFDAVRSVLLFSFIIFLSTKVVFLKDLLWT